MMGALRDIWEAHVGHGAMKVTSYIEPQDRHLSRFRGTTVSLVEIGVWMGGSLQIWRDYLGDRCWITGVDIDPRCKQHEDRQIEVLIGSQSDREFLDTIAPMDIVIDDGSHHVPDQILTFEALWPRLAPHGVYIVEDTSTSYWGGEFGPGSFLDYARQRVDDVNRWWHADEPNDWTLTLDSVHYYPGMVVFEKAPMERPAMISNAGQGQVDINNFPMNLVAHYADR